MSPSTLVRQFAERHGCVAANAAMQHAAAAVLIKYDEKHPTSGHISVSWLCDLLGVSLRGTENVMRDSYGRVPGSGASRIRHDAELRFGTPPVVRLRRQLPEPRARLSIAHELGHFLVRSVDYDLGRSASSTPEEEEVAEYGARLLLMPPRLFASTIATGTEPLPARCLRTAGALRTTIRSVAVRLFDPDVRCFSLAAIILWRMAEEQDDTTGPRFVPWWFVAPNTFVPRAAWARHSCVVMTAAMSAEPDTVAGNVEDVAIGSLAGRFRVDAFAWGRLSDQSRVVLSCFSVPEE
jgi:hypothetical protein